MYVLCFILLVRDIPNNLPRPNYCSWRWGIVRQYKVQQNTIVAIKQCRSGGWTIGNYWCFLAARLEMSRVGAIFTSRGNSLKYVAPLYRKFDLQMSRVHLGTFSIWFSPERVTLSCVSTTGMNIALMPLVDLPSRPWYTKLQQWFFLHSNKVCVFVSEWRSATLHFFLCVCRSSDTNFAVSVIAKHWRHTWHHSMCPRNQSVGVWDFYRSQGTNSSLWIGTGSPSDTRYRRMSPSLETLLMRGALYPWKSRVAATLTTQSINNGLHLPENNPSTPALPTMMPRRP